MTNKEIASAFDLLARIMELHGENPFKIRSYQNAYSTLKKLDTPLGSLSVDQLMEIKGIGEAIAEKIQSLLQTGKMPTLEKYKAKTPPGVVDMLNIQGLGPKKVATLWKEHDITSPGELLYACNENRLIEYKGFGEKTQENIKTSINFLQSNAGKYIHSLVRSHTSTMIDLLNKNVRDSKNEITGHLRRGEFIVHGSEILTTCSYIELQSALEKEAIEWKSHHPKKVQAIWAEFLPVTFHITNKNDFGLDQIHFTGPELFAKKIEIKSTSHPSEEHILKEAVGHFISPELRDIEGVLTWSRTKLDALIEVKDIKGVIHTHSTYSDGIHSLSEMAVSAKEYGYEYLVITDHSQAAAYARGLKYDQLTEQWQEIDKLNQTHQYIPVLKGIECDILTHGDLDYDPEILSKFDLIIASIHSAFQMDEDKATKRMVKAIENQYTNIIGHPSGRLILSREGYPLDLHKITDACKANQVAIELNCNPQRMDIDYSFIKLCIDKGVLIAINPDAHNRSSIQDIPGGVIAARKGMLPKELCLNALSKDELIKFCRKN